MSTNDKLRLLILGAHPDDAEYHAGGLAIRYRQQGHDVKMVSVTDGAAGHHERPPAELRMLRQAEARAAGEVIGAEYLTWDNPDGALLPTLDVRLQIIREIRRFQPDLVLTHRTCDYHPDHRAVGQAVQDASYLVTVPHVAPDVPALHRDPVVAYMVDLFTRPCPLSPDVILDISTEVDTIVEMLARHASQVFEWLPYEEGILADVPNDNEARAEWLRAWYVDHITPRADRFRETVTDRYGPNGAGLQHIEVYEISEYAGAMSDELRQRLFCL